MSNDRLFITKSIVSFIVGAGVGKIVHAVIENNIEAETRTEKVTVPVASFVVAYAAKDASRQYTDAKIDKIADQVNKIRAQFKNDAQK